MKNNLLLFFFFTPTLGFGQNEISAIRDSILREGKKLYRSEFASWYGTDIFMENYKGDQANIGGYFSYAENENEVCLFYSKGVSPEVIGTITFDKNDKASLDTYKRSLSKNESEIYLIRELAKKEISKDTSLFKSYKNCTFNLIPFIDSNGRKVYVLTGTSRNDIVIFGNDYLITFDDSNKIVSKKQLHKNIIPANFAEPKKQEQGPMHTHLPETGSFITATDICTTMLYEKIANWKQHIVVSENYMSIWNCESNTLVIIPYRK